MHLLLIHPFYLPPGEAGGARWNELVRIWTAQGHQLTVLAGTVHYGRGETYAPFRGRWFSQTEEPGLNVYWTYTAPWRGKGWLGRFWGYVTFVASALWAGLFRVRTGYDVVVATSPPLLVGLVGWALARRSRVPLVTEIRDLWPDAPVELGVLRHQGLIRLAYALERWLYRQSAKVVVLTPAFARVLQEQKGVAPDRLRVVPNAVDFRLIDPVRRTFNREAFRRSQGMDGGFWVVYAGAHGFANGLERLLPVAQRLKGEPVRFLLLGEGAEKKRLMEAVRALGLTNVQFRAGCAREEAFRWLLASDLGLVVMRPTPVFRTMYTNKLFDYWAAGLPVLLALDGASRALVEAAKGGQFVEPDDPDAWVTSIRRYRHALDLTLDHGRNGYAYARQHFDRRRLAADYLSLITHVSQNR